MGIIGSFLIVLAFILVIDAIIDICDDEWGPAAVTFIGSILVAVIGMWFIKNDEQNDERNDEQEIEIICSEYRVTQQTNILIEDGDTVETTKYIIYYKK